MKIIKDHRHCGVAKTLKILGGKWTAILLHHIFEGTIRFGELERAMDGISPKTLSLRLKQLEEEGIIKRTVFPEVPLHVEYTLTRKGRSLQEVFDAMDEWGK